MHTKFRLEVEDLGIDGRMILEIGWVDVDWILLVQDRDQ